MPTEPVDLFADAFQIFVGGLGSAIYFSLSDPEQQAETTVGRLPSHRVATIRLTPELMKGLAFLLTTQIKLHEQNNPRIELPTDSMTRISAAVGPEAWGRFWGYT
jgi:hypothetical protein